MADGLSAWDYVVFALMLVLSSLIGLYHGYKSSKKQETANSDYLLAGKSMSWFPLFVSIVGSYMSAISLMGVPSEIYTFGGMFWLSILAFPLGISMAIYIFAPIYRTNGFTSANEYLERRFSKPVRTFGSILFILQTVLYLSVALYAPSLALEAVVGLRMEISLVATAIVCNIYTTIGGMKGVIWTDVFQTSIILIGLIVVLVIGINEVGSLSRVFEIAYDGGRLNLLNFDLDPTVRNTFWGFLIGYSFTLMPFFCNNQITVQRYLSAKSQKTVFRALTMSLIGIIILVTMCVIAGLVMYAVYHDCDPKHSKEITNLDQILAYFLVHKISHLKGVPGILMATLFSGALSTASSGLNSLAAITYEDIVKHHLPTKFQEEAVKYTKYIACIYGFIILGGAFVVSAAGSMVMQITVSIQGILAAPYFAMFLLGVFYRKGNSKGAVSGCVFGLCLNGFLSGGSMVYPPNKNILSTSIRGCSSFNASSPNNTTGTFGNPFKPYEEGIAAVFSLSYLWYGFIGITSSLVVGYIVSHLTSNGEEEVDEKLQFDYQKVFRCFSSKKCCRSGTEVRPKTQQDSLNGVELKSYRNNENGTAKEV